MDRIANTIRYLYYHKNKMYHEIADILNIKVDDIYRILGKDIPSAPTIEDKEKQ
mgnify:FL=1